jgi:hypothetical protein
MMDHGLGYLSAEVYKRTTVQAESIRKQLNNYIAYLKRSKQGEKDLPTGYTIHEESKVYRLDDLFEATQPINHDPLTLLHLPIPQSSIIL